MRIIVRNTSIILTDYTLGDYPELERYFTLYDPITHSYSAMGMKYDEDKRCLYLPRGMDTRILKKLTNYQDELDIEYNSDPFDRIPEMSIKYMPRDDVQKEALEFVLGKGQYYQNNNQTQLSLNLRTGKGKTYVAIAALSYLSVKACIIATNKEWLVQWKNCFIEYTNIDEREVLIIEGSVGIFKILNGITDVSRYKTFMITHSSLHSFGTKHGWDKITELFIKLRVYMKVFDEAHLNFTNIADVDFYTNTKKTLYLTATPARSDRSENFIYDIYFKNVPAIDLFDEDEDPHTRYNSIRFSSMPTPQEKQKIFNNTYGINRNAYTNYIVNNKNFYNVMYILMNKILHINGKVLLYIGTNDAILKVKDWIEENYPEFRNEVGIFTSFIPMSERKKQLDKQIILTTTKSAGAALDVKGLKASFVVAEPFKSEVLAIQTLGRTRDPNTDYYDLVDDGFRQLSRFYTSKKPIFRKYATQCKEYRLNYQDLSELSDKLKAQREDVKSQYARKQAFIIYRNIDKK